MDRLAKLKQQKEVLNAKIKKAEAYQALKKSKQEKHLKFLIGEYYFHQALQTNTVAELKQKLLDNLKREADKNLVSEW